MSGGSRIFRHESGPEEVRISGGDAPLIEAIDAHLARCFAGAERWVFHEIVSPTVHLDVHVAHHVAAAGAHIADADARGKGPTEGACLRKQCNW